MSAHDPLCPCADTMHTCTNLTACRWCQCDLIAVVEQRERARIRAAVEGLCRDRYSAAVTDSILAAIDALREKS